MDRFPVSPGSQAIKMDRFPIFPGSQASNPAQNQLKNNTRHLKPFKQTKYDDKQTSRGQNRIF